MIFPWNRQQFWGDARGSIVCFHSPFITYYNNSIVRFFVLFKFSIKFAFKIHFFVSFYHSFLTIFFFARVKFWFSLFKKVGFRFVNVFRGENCQQKKKCFCGWCDGGRKRERNNVKNHKQEKLSRSRRTGCLILDTV